MADEPDENEIILHNSDGHGSASTNSNCKGWTLNFVLRYLPFLSAPKMQPCSSGLACIYTYTHTAKTGANRDAVQIGVGIIKRIHGDPADPKPLFDVQFCLHQKELSLKKARGLIHCIKILQLI
jgi:hypothetical protein